MKQIKYRNRSIQPYYPSDILIITSKPTAIDTMANALMSFVISKFSLIIYHHKFQFIATRY